MVLGCGLPHDRANRHAAISLVDVVELFDAVDVDQVLGPGEAEVEQGDQRLAAGEHLGVVQLAEQGHGRGGRIGCVVLEGGRLHLYSHP
jgi:hypothetical protein